MLNKEKGLSQLFTNMKPIIGMIHLRPLPGSPLYDPITMNMNKITQIAIDEARKLEEGGVDGVQIENIWDFPYLKGSEIGPETVAAMSAIAIQVREKVALPLGVNCHLNGGKSALAIGCAVGAKWIRVFEWVNAYISHAGITEGIGGQLSRYRSFLRAQEIQFFCDINVKHGSHFIISDRSVAEQAHDAETEGADAIIVTGFETGKAPTPEKVKEVCDIVNIPVFIGSGVNEKNVHDLLRFAQGAIIGSYFKRDNDWKKEVDKDRVKSFMKVVNQLRSEIES